MKNSLITKELKLYHPPQISANIIVGTVLRFIASSASSVAAISNLSLASAMGCIATSATAAHPMVNAVKITKIELWAMPSTTTATTVAVWFNSNLTPYSSQTEMSDSSTSTAEPAHLRVRPPQRSLAADWIQALAGTASQTIFAVTAPAGSILDVHIAGVLVDGAGQGGPSITLVGATTGGGYYTAADGDGGIWAPVSKTVST